MIVSRKAPDPRPQIRTPGGSSRRNHEPYAQRLYHDVPLHTEYPQIQLLGWLRVVLAACYEEGGWSLLDFRHSTKAYLLDGCSLLRIWFDTYLLRSCVVR